MSNGRMSQARFYALLMLGDQPDDVDEKALFIAECRELLPHVEAGLWKQALFLRICKVLSVSQERVATILGPDVGLPYS